MAAENIDSDMLIDLFVMLLKKNALMARDIAQNGVGCVEGIEMLAEYGITRYGADAEHAHQWALDMNVLITNDVMNWFYDMVVEKACIALSKEEE